MRKSFSVSDVLTFVGRLTIFMGSQEKIIFVNNTSNLATL